MTPTLRAAIALFAGVLLLGLWIAWAGHPGFDPAISKAVAGQRAHSGFWLGFTRLGDWEGRLAVGLGAAAWQWWRARGLAALVLLSVAAVQTWTNSGLKMLFARARPDLFEHLDYTTSLSFPSGHAAQNAALYLMIGLLVDRRLLWIAVPVALLIGCSRVVLGVHWPSDVIGGWLEGAAFALLAVHFAQGVERGREGKIEAGFPRARE